MRQVLLLCLLLSVACNRSAPSAPPAPAGQERPAASRLGAPLSDAPAMPVSALIAEAHKYDGQEVKVQGRVGAVCQKKGCWMTLGDDEPGGPKVRVTFKDYAFFVPKNSLGRTATVEGRFQVATLSQAEAQHYADDEAQAGAPRRVVQGPERTLSLVAAGVELQ
ncbi:MAG: DUF4920 domain-containing protein [Myxococcales bacterium]|nr:DUF4920 domain-containing protein [Myxococcota bacterium]MDW8283078.1 DUF4920 domain-containing protein [Myxococcales bacterium]